MGQGSSIPEESAPLRALAQVNQDVVQWHRQKAGSIQAAHAGSKNERAGGVLPGARCGAQAAWLRWAVLSFNRLTASKRLALPAERLRARPKPLRLLIFRPPGQLGRHARRLVLRLRRSLNRFNHWRGALPLLPRPACDRQAHPVDRKQVAKSARERARLNCAGASHGSHKKAPNGMDRRLPSSPRPA